MLAAFFRVFLQLPEREADPKLVALDYNHDNKEVAVGDLVDAVNDRVIPGRLPKGLLHEAPGHGLCFLIGHASGHHPE